MADYDTAIQVINEVKKAILGKDEYIVKSVAAILAGGHILLNDIPGVGKTTLALALAKAMSLSQNRVQFTPDVLPSDIIGFSMYQKATGTFEYHPGSIMCNLFLADEINRTSPKTQSALLEVMEEQSVSIDGVTRLVPHPFVVIATQNPYGSAGTQMLPESQLDRFMICMSLGYPEMEDELSILKGEHKSAAVNKVMNKEELLLLQQKAAEVYVHNENYQYMGDLVKGTREHEMVDLGVSPRGTICLLKMAKALAFLRQRNYVAPEDVVDVAIPVMSHRILLGAKARVNHKTAQDIILDILHRTKRPSLKR
jgi:MoxR-like ATPase